MGNIITLTVNPVVDKNTNVDKLLPDCNLRCTIPEYYAGGGGINVSRAIKNLGGNSLAIYMAGGRKGELLQEIMNKAKIEQSVVQIERQTRENLSVMDKSTKINYHFGLPGPFVKKTEWQDCLTLVEKHLKEDDFLVASGKLTSGIPDDFYALLGDIVKEKRAKLVLDTKGNALKHAVDSNIYLFKPNLSELASLYGVKAISYETLEKISMDFLKNHKCDMMVVSLGSRGALLVTQKKLSYFQAPIVPIKNRIGAGDSMVAGMLLSLSLDKSLTKMVQYGVACGAAATMRSGPELCDKNDVDKIFGWIHSKQKNTN